MVTKASFKKHLIHTCTVERSTQAASLSGELIDTWADQATGVRCRLTRKTERYASESLSREQLLSDILITEPGADIEEDDRVYDFAYYATGTATGQGKYRVLHKLHRNSTQAHHESYVLEQIG